MLAGISQFHHACSNEDTAERVRGGQEGRVLDGNGSAGDFPFGYSSEYQDPEAAKAFTGRGSKPKKVVVIEPTAAGIVREVFRRFLAYESITAITRWLNGQGSAIPQIGKKGWRHQYVRRILANPKYVGNWTYGKTTTVSNSDGKSKRVPARADQRITTVQRPTLRIIDLGIFDAVQQRLAELKVIYGMKEGGKRRGPAAHYRKIYSKSLLYGVIRCSNCGGRFIHAGNGRVRALGCSNHVNGDCHVSARVPIIEAESHISEILCDALLKEPGWLESARRQMESSIHQHLAELPDTLQRAEDQLQNVQQQIQNLIDAISTGIRSDAIAQKLASLEREKHLLASKIQALRHLPTDKSVLPSEQWVRDELTSLLHLLAENQPSGIAPIREILDEVIAEEVKSPGKRRGYIRLRIRLRATDIIRSLISKSIRPELPGSSSTVECNGEEREILVDLGEPTRMDQWAPKIAHWRKEKVTWKEIAARTGLKLANAHFAYKRYLQGGVAA